MIRSVLAAAGLCLGAVLPAAALTLAPGDTLDSADYFDFGEVATSDADWYGTHLGSFSASANVTRDGFDGYEVVTGLYDVDAELSVDVYDGGSATTTFAYGFLATDNGLFGTNGALGYTVSGFADYTVEIGWSIAGFPYVPFISRSADGDTVTVEYFDPLDALNPIETLLLRVDAPAFALTGTGTAAISIDSFGTYAEPLSGLPAPAPVPLPPAGLALACGLAVLAGARRRCRA
ncbi:hypothetical protein [Mangrovicoccus algicola]|uniref:PEP-CTERM sorting domain-containing protein n=1 Tax=Mangrovicoccus algicola TaxID=2771008 RepID=A0A8J6YPE2_9RHOB|nr:hypothetical protein [Mangrovicoccus algicola]MBE3636918.1 hypothetical protein [Mangrovicoccus algicola]